MKTSRCEFKLNKTLVIPHQLQMSSTLADHEGVLHQGLVSYK